VSDIGKMRAAAAALDFVEDGMVVGLGTGSTASHFVRMLGERVAQGRRVVGVPTSEATRRLAEQVSIPLISLDQADRIDVTVDGADEVDPSLRLLKGGGGALLREKIIAHATDHMVVIVDPAKLVDHLGAFRLPVEVIAFGFTITAKKVFDLLREAGCPTADIKLREAGAPGRAFVTDSGNSILDCACTRIPDPDALAIELNRIPGVVENGLFPLFPRTRRTIVVGGDDGVRMMEH